MDMERIGVFCSLENSLSDPWHGGGVKTLYFPRGKEKWLGTNNVERAVEGGGKDNGLCPSFATTLRLRSLGCRVVRLLLHSGFFVLWDAKMWKIKIQKF